MSQHIENGWPNSEGTPPHRDPLTFKSLRKHPHILGQISRSKPKAQVSNPKLRRPSALTVDNEAYEAICSRKATRPTLVTSPKVIQLPPRPEA